MFNYVFDQLKADIGYISVSETLTPYLS